MLLQLTVRNFALIQDLCIDFNKGFNVLSGETGSGKSILIDSISFVLGGKFNKTLIRTGEEKTYVEAIFAIENPKTIEVLQALEIEYEDFLILSRETFRTGKTIAKINGKSVIVSDLRKLSETLLDIHGQHENQNLLNSANHIQYLDDFGEEKLKNSFHSYREKYNQVILIKEKIKKIEENSGDNQKKIEFYKYQIDDIEKAKFKEDEDLELQERFEFLSNIENIEKVLTKSHGTLYGSDGDYASVFDKVNYVIRDLRTIEKSFPKVKEISDSLEESYYILEQVIRDLSSCKEGIYYDKNELDFINERLYIIENYKKRYGSTIKEILEYKSNLESELLELENGEEIIKSLNKDKDKLELSMKLDAEEIHRIRKELAINLEKLIKKELNYIGLEKTIIKIEVNFEDHFYETGCDKVIFLVSTNPGEPLKPLDTIVSGGELSRIMLALKTVFIDKDNIPTVIFDEIDTGISGRTAQSVAEKMYLISKQHQVFCITHLPQIASMCDFNYLVRKEVIEEKTYTFVKKMEMQDKLETIAKMIGGSEVTDLTLEHSREMLSLADEKKLKLC